MTDLALLDESVPVDDFITWSEWALMRVGFRPSNTLALVGVCRDELMADFDDSVEAVWGKPFDVGALAGMVLVGSGTLSGVPLIVVTMHEPTRDQEVKDAVALFAWGATP